VSERALLLASALLLLLLLCEMTSVPLFCIVAC
jgi:hypothetical protein